jgi:hypothetical protein
LSCNKTSRCAIRLGLFIASVRKQANLAVLHSLAHGVFARGDRGDAIADGDEIRAANLVQDKAFSPFDVVCDKALLPGPFECAWKNGSGWEFEGGGMKRNRIRCVALV